jgi:hypothetical protein
MPDPSPANSPIESATESAIESFDRKPDGAGISVKVDPAAGRLEPPAHEPESWWSRAKALRDEGRLDEAIAVVERDGDRAEALLVQADLHMDRLRRARAEREIDVARDAWKKAASCARAYAASATSGGEGAARSIERDRILAELGPAPL